MKTAVPRWKPSPTISKREQMLLKRLEKNRRLFAMLRLHRADLFDDAFQEELGGMYRDTGEGKVPVPPAQLAMVLLLQAYTGVSDADAVEMTVVDARWQMVLDVLGADEAAFSQGALPAFRERMIRHDMDRRLLERTVELAKKTAIFDWKKLPKTLRLAVDSRPLQGAGRVEDTINLLGHATLKLLRAAAAKRHLTTALKLDPGMEAALVALARTAELLGDREEVERLLQQAAETASFLPLAARLSLWRRDADIAAELLRELRPDTLPRRVAQLILTILVTGQAPDELPMPAGDQALRTLRARSFAAQLHAECNALLGRRERALDAIAHAAAVGVTDVVWLDRCPLFDELRSEPRFSAASDVIAARAEHVVAAYLTPAAP